MDLSHAPGGTAVLVYSPALAGYDLGPDHPLRPERFTLAVTLMEAYGLVPAGTAAGSTATDGSPLAVVAPAPASDDEIEMVHSAAYVAAVRKAGEDPSCSFPPAAGLGTLDTPVFPGMHEAAELVAGGAILATDEVLSGRHKRAFNVAGGLHHAHRDRAAGFCVYNDVAIGIAHALRRLPDLRVLYVDIDAHHGDGVQEAFYEEPKVLTISMHETGAALFPGTGFPDERGAGPGLGYAANIPLPVGATDACYRMVFQDLVWPLARSFHPDLVVAQCGADALHHDPLTSLGLTLPGYAWLVDQVVSLADELTQGRLVAHGGGGYAWQHAVPRAWTRAAAALAGVELPEPIPDSWRRDVRATTGVEPPAGLTEDHYAIDPAENQRLLAQTRRSLDRLEWGE